MRRLAILAVLTIGAASAQTPPQAPAAEVDCLSAGILAILSVDRELTAPRDGGRLSITVTLQNRTPRAAAFVLNFTSPNVQMPAVNQWRRLEAQAQGTYFAGTLPRGTLVSDEALRDRVQLRCVR